MSNLAVVLEWKFPGEGGIETKEGRLAAWPSKLGPFPDDATLAQWTGEYDAQQKEADQKQDEAKKQQVFMEPNLFALWKRVVRGETSATDDIEAKLQAIESGTKP